MTERLVKFVYEKETKSSVRYQEAPGPGNPPVIGTLYVQKWFVGDAKAIELQISFNNTLNQTES